MIYRLYTPEDFAALYAIEELCFEPLFRFDRLTMRQLAGRSNAATWLAEENGELKGFAIVEWTERRLRLCGGGPSLPECKSRVTAYIQTIEVAPEARGRGVGRELLGCRRHEGFPLWKRRRSGGPEGAAGCCHSAARTGLAASLTRPEPLGPCWRRWW